MRKKAEMMAAFNAAVRGWAFGPIAWLPGKIRAGEQEAAKLPDNLRVEAEARLAVMRSYLQESL